MNLLLLSLLFAGKKDEQIVELQRQVADLQQQLIQCQNDRLACETRNPAPPDALEEAKAAELYDKAMEHVEAWEGEQARVLIDQILSDYGKTRAAAKAMRVYQELAVVGQPAPAIGPEVDFWFRGQGDYNPTGMTLVVFWEAWCPHCKREMPALDAWTASLRAEGSLTVIGITKVTKSSTNDTVNAFIEEQGIGFPIAKDRGGLHEAYNVSGIPAAAVVQDGVIVWRGHPGRLDEAMLRSHL